MEKTWASGAIELLKHADDHISKGEAFDQRIAFISIDNSVETAIRTFINIPFSLSGVKFSFKEKEDAGNSFPRMLNLVIDKASDKVSNIELSDVEFYHRLRNQLYHDGTGLSVDKNHLEAYRTIAELLLRNLFQIEISYSTSDNSLSTLILSWEEINKLIRQLLEANDIDFSATFKWEEAFKRGVLTKHQFSLYQKLSVIRNEQVHATSGEIESNRIKYGIEIASELRKLLEPDTKKIIYSYFLEHPTQAFSARGIGYIFQISKKYAIDILESLENDEKINSGTEEDTGLKLFQVKHSNT
ncbi:hypothetical protein QYS49_36215 [Marivirga salinae]|uniref:Uncharacterized protein n=1 Tax=Marivirga salinarum TaxID=3059078 RepID=A0AA51N929_9BACT|nr:hypothetical protein [Marivirga sp. BDSF4-3]WMN10843.1 hypothetical protein QYS49_36215 [Marivirga sp. BDSF4-3]